jgi:hypothetical protein
MPIYKTDRPFTEEQLKEMDIIHDPNTTMFEDQYDESYVVEDFISGVECATLQLWFKDNFPKIGYEINQHVLHITFPMLHKVVSDIVRPKIYEHFGDDVVFYSDVAQSDPMSVGDQFFKSVKPYGLHTDAVTHLTGYRPYKDIIIPVELDSIPVSEYVTFNQRYRGRATHFMRGRQIGSFANYANVVRHQSYEEYGVENLEHNARDQKILEDIMPAHIPMSIYEGLSIEKILPWRPKCAIIHDASVLHAPADYQKHGCNYKIGLTLHLMKRDPHYNNRLEGYYTPFSRYAKPLIQA